MGDRCWLGARCSSAMPLAYSSSGMPEDVVEAAARSWRRRCGARGGGRAADVPVGHYTEGAELIDFLDVVLALVTMASCSGTWVLSLRTPCL